MKTLVVHAHPLDEGSYSAALRDAVCEALYSSGVEHTLVRLAQGEVPDMEGGSYEQLIAVFPTWWGGPPAVVLDWLQNQLAPFVEGGEPAAASPFRSIKRVSVVTTHGSSRLMNRMQGEPGKQTWRRVVTPMCHPDAVFEWISLYKIDRSTQEQRSAFLDKVRASFTNERVPV